MAHDQTDSELKFARPPIVEAVMERRFATHLSPDTLNTLRLAFEKKFPAVAQMNEVSIAIGQSGVDTRVTHTTAGYRLVDPEGTAVIMLSAQSIVFSRLAPYPGWADFSDAATRVFQTAREIMGYSTLSRIAVRYVNRIDVPLVDETGAPVAVSAKDYILIHPEYPATAIPQILGFTMQCVAPLEEIECMATINVAATPSPVPNHGSFVFDIDVGRNSNVPQKEDEIASLMELIRHEKNRIFVSCLTNKTKETFN